MQNNIFFVAGINLPNYIIGKDHPEIMAIDENEEESESVNEQLYSPLIFHFQ